MNAKQEKLLTEYRAANCARGFHVDCVHKKTRTVDIVLDMDKVKKWLEKTAPADLKSLPGPDTPEIRADSTRKPASAKETITKGESA